MNKLRVFQVFAVFVMIAVAMFVTVRTIQNDGNFFSSGSMFKSVRSVECYVTKPDGIQMYTYTEGVGDTTRIQYYSKSTKIYKKDNPRHHEKIDYIIYPHNAFTSCTFIKKWVKKDGAE